MRGGFRGFSVVIALACGARHAQAAPSDAALAETLFEAGRTLLTEGRIQEACDKFSESQRIEPKLGTLLNLAVCHETEGRTASAWAEYTQAQSIAHTQRQPDREAYAAQRLELLRERLSFIVVTWTAPASDQSLEIDGISLGQSAVGTPLPMDPGAHVLTVRAADRDAWTIQLLVSEGPGSQRVEVPKLRETPTIEPAPTALPPVAARPAGVSVGPSRSAGPEPARRPVAHRESVSWQRPAEYAAFALGALSVAVGSWAAMSAIADNRAGESECDASGCTARGLDRIDKAGTKADIATAAFIVGAIGIGAGTYWAVTASSNGDSTRSARIDARFEF